MPRATTIASIIACASVCAMADQPITLHDRLVRLGNRVHNIREQEMRDLIPLVQWEDFEEIGKFYREEADFEQRVRITKVVVNSVLREFRLTDIGASVNLVGRWKDSPHFEVWSVKPQSPAAMCGLRAHDKIVALGDKQVHFDMGWDAFRNYIRDHWWQKADITVLRDDKEVKLRIDVVGREQLRKDDRFNNGIWKKLIEEKVLFEFAQEWCKHFDRESPLMIPERWVFILEEDIVGSFYDE